MFSIVFASKDFWFGALIFGGGIIIAQLVVNYNFSDWLKDHFFSLVGSFQSAAHARLARLRAQAAKVEGSIAAAARKAEFWK